MAFPLTDFEQSGSFTTLANEATFLAACVTEAGGRMAVDQIGTTLLGNPIWLVRLGYPTAPSYASLADQHPIMVVAGQHGDEPAGREGTLAWVRDVAATSDPDLLEIMSTRGIVVIPTVNPDGRDANTRTNSAGQDINRDHMALAHAEATAVQTVIRIARPCMGMDQHENPTGGTTIEVQLKTPTITNALPAMGTLSDSLYAHVGAAFTTAGYDWTEYGGVSGDGPNVMRNSFGARGIPALLTETARPFAAATRVAVQQVALAAGMDWYTANAEAVMALVATRRTDAIAKGETQTTISLGSGTLDPAPMGYRLTLAKYDLLPDQREVFEIQMYPIVGSTDYFVPVAQPMAALIPWMLDGASNSELTIGARTYEAPTLDAVEFRPEYSSDDGESWTAVRDWTLNAIAALDTATLPNGALQLRVQARDASTPADVSSYDEVSVTVANGAIEYRVTYQEDGGVETIAQDWTAGDLSEQIDTTALADGPLVIRVYARDASSPADVSVSSVNLTVENGVAATIAPAFIAAASTVYSPTITEGSPPAETVVPAFIAATSEVYAPTLLEGVPAGTLAPAFINATSVVYAPVLLPGSATLLPAFIASGAVVYAPIVGLVDVGAFQTVAPPDRRFVVTPPARRF